MDLIFCVFVWLCVCLHENVDLGCVSVCVTVVNVDPVIKCYGPEGWPDIKALNDAIYYVLCVCVCVRWGTLLLSSLMFLVVGGGGWHCIVVRIDCIVSRSQNLGVLSIIITVIISLCGRHPEQLEQPSPVLIT